MENILFSICARGGSKGIKNKNISDFLGKPLISYSIEQALGSKYCKDIFISTDSDDIAEICKKYGASIISLRPESLANDFASKFDVWKYHLNNVENELNKSFQYFFDLDCTCPLRSSSDIDNMIDSFINLKHDYDGAITVSDARKNPYFNILEFEKSKGLYVSKSSPKRVIRRQDAPVVYDHVASMYLFKTAYIKDADSLFEGNITGYSVPFERSLDIDSAADRILVETLFKGLNSELGRLIT